MPTEAYDALAAPVTPDEVGALLSLTVMINAWNAVGVRICGWFPGHAAVRAAQRRRTRRPRGQPRVGGVSFAFAALDALVTVTWELPHEGTHGYGRRAGRGREFARTAFHA